MKKLLFAILLIGTLHIAYSQNTQHQTNSVPDTSASSLLNLRTYGNYFDFQNGTVNVTSHYIMSAPRADRRTFGELAGEVGIDTLLEFALLSYYSQSVVQIRPVEAEAILPADNPRLAGLKLGAATYKELLMLRFLDPNNTAAIGRYEGMIRFIQDRNCVTRAQIEAYFRDGIRSFINEIVNEEFNRISFVMGSPTGGYNAVLTRNPQNGHYMLRYTDARDNTKELSAVSLEALSSAMSRNTAEFNQAGINTVRTQAALIPAVVLSDVALNETKNILANFYLNPSATTYNIVKDWYVIYSNAILETRNEKYRYLQHRANAVLTALNEAFEQSVILDTNRQLRPAVLDRTQAARLIELR